MSGQRSGGDDDRDDPDGKAVNPENPKENKKPADAKKNATPAKSERDVTQPNLDEGVTPRVGDEMRGHIGERLRAHYDAVAREPVPDRFLDLLAQLEADSDSNEADPEK